MTYKRCTRIRNDENDVKAWCSVKGDDSGQIDKGDWGNCEPTCQPDECLSYEDKCIASRYLNGKIESDKNILFDARTEAPCKFPFKYLDNVHHSCTKSNPNSDRLWDGLWCATSVDENLEMKNWGYCSETCPNEDTNWPIILGTLPAEMFGGSACFMK